MVAYLNKLQNDPNYIIILREMDRHETDVLFEHTRRLRSRSQLVKEEEARGMVRRKQGRRELL